MSDDAVARHYAHGALEEQILAALVTIGVDPEHLQPDQLAPVDEFHIGGRAATVALVGRWIYTRACGCSMWEVGWAARPDTSPIVIRSWSLEST
jgi:hypothetical protein